VEREHQEAINEEAKHMEKLANKKSLLLKKVRKELWIVPSLVLYCSS